MLGYPLILHNRELLCGSLLLSQEVTSFPSLLQKVLHRGVILQEEMRREQEVEKRCLNQWGAQLIAFYMSPLLV